MLFLGIIVIAAYLQPAIYWLFNVIGQIKMQKINNTEDLKKEVWFIRHRSAISLSEIRSTLIIKETMAKKRLDMFFKIGLPSIWFFTNIILIKHIVSYYIKKKFNFEMPATSIFIYISTLILLTLWTSGLLLNKFTIHRIHKLLVKADELEAAASKQ